MEDVWRKLKKKVHNSFLKSLDYLKELFKETFHKIIDDTAFYEN
ncbi:MAG: hypothetical protein LBM96_04460 [Methanobrevibacter sp.]|nr:hypothetical protein [Candidatus Methanoflexus mossambicus]